jgi:hypothetical protein
VFSKAAKSVKFSPQVVAGMQFGRFQLFSFKVNNAAK